MSGTRISPCSELIIILKLVCVCHLHASFSILCMHPWYVFLKNYTIWSQMSIVLRPRSPTLISLSLKLP